jgi:hypothetical protein
MAGTISRRVLRDWQEHPGKLTRPSGSTCPRCSPGSTLRSLSSYAYLLGIYLGDGCISRHGPEKKRVWKLRIMCADAWPGLLDECKQAMQSVRPDNSVAQIQREGCVEVVSCSKRWPCLFPQHALGRKHERSIELEPWQQEIVASAGPARRGLAILEADHDLGRPARGRGQARRVRGPEVLMGLSRARTLR